MSSLNYEGVSYKRIRDCDFLGNIGLHRLAPSLKDLKSNLFCDVALVEKLKGQLHLKSAVQKYHYHRKVDKQEQHQLLYKQQKGLCVLCNNKLNSVSGSDIVTHHNPPVYILVNKG